MMKKSVFILFAMALMLGALPLGAQTAPKGVPMYYDVTPEGDTIYMDVVPPVWVFPKGSRVDRVQWRKYTKLVYNFSKVYPYALMGARITKEADTYIDQNNLSRGAKYEYVNAWQKELLRNFEGVVRHMTVSQGQLLVRLMDREVGKSSYKIVKDYRNGFTAGFWQGVAKLFGQNLKSRYDPDGQDKMTEELVKKWEKGEFDDLYFSIFFEPPKKPVIPEKYR